MTMVNTWVLSWLNFMSSGGGGHIPESGLDD